MEKAVLLAKVNRVFKIYKHLESNKDLYSELDQLIHDLKDEKGLEKHGLRVKDNFQNKNTVFKPAGVRRFDFEFLEK